jgi:hypothetical protein
MTGLFLLYRKLLYPFDRILAMSSSIPTFYRIFFPSIDPIFAFAGVLTNLFAQPAILNSYNASFTSHNIPIETAVCMEMTSGFLLAIFFLQIVLLRIRPDDLAVWRCVQISILIQDIAILYAFAKSLSAQGRLDWESWRAEEWTNYLITAGAASTRVAFLTGVGFGDSKARKLSPAL